MAVNTAFSFAREAWNSPIVYIFYKDRVPLYVGYSARGFKRPLDPGHDKYQARDKADTLRVLTFDTIEEAKAAEKQLIYWLAPVYNQEDAAYEWQQCNAPAFSVNSGTYIHGYFIENEIGVALHEKYTKQEGGTWVEDFWLGKPELLEKAILN